MNSQPVNSQPVNSQPARTLAVVSGGVGAARFLAGLVDAIDHGLIAGLTAGDQVSAVVNTGDDCVLHGLAISPDIDTVTYTLAGAIDPERGWGLVDETWSAMEALGRYAAVKPPDSAAAPQWFNLGDRDLATHFYRTARLAEGASLTEVTDEIRSAWGVPVRIVPMSDDRLSTMLTIAGDTDTEISFQDYFVRLRHSVAVRDVRFKGDATLSAAARKAIDLADVVVLAPSNPIVSIGPIRSLAGVDDLLATRRDRVVAVSPIVGGAALKGPADRLMTELGHDASVVGVARLYAPIASVLVIDTVDEHLADAVEAAGMRCVVAPSVMSSSAVARQLAATTVHAAN